MWKSLSHVAIIATILAGIAGTLLYVEQSKKLPEWVGAVRGHTELLTFFVIVCISFAILVGLFRLKRLEESVRDEQKTREAEFKSWLTDRGREIAQKTQDTSTVATLNRLLTDGDDLLSKAKNIGMWNRAMECSRAQEDISRWEHEVIEWLKEVKPGFEADFTANFNFPTGADVGATLILRVAIRLERLRAVKASLT
jgi:hypothetical protein